jgi:hypothetical protein
MYDNLVTDGDPDISRICTVMASFWKVPIKSTPPLLHMVAHFIHSKGFPKVIFRALSLSPRLHSKSKLIERDLRRFLE